MPERSQLHLIILDYTVEVLLQICDLFTTGKKKQQKKQAKTNHTPLPPSAHDCELSALLVLVGKLLLFLTTGSCRLTLEQLRE